MALNKVQLTINSRMYTVVSDESTGYMEMLGRHINEKVSAVMSEGRNIMGERPVVLAALNICDEYYKLAADKSSMETEQIIQIKSENTALKDTITDLKEKNKMLLDEIETLESGQITIAQTEAVALSAQLQKELEDARTQVKFLEGQIKVLEGKNASMKKEFDDKVDAMKKDYDRREQEIFDMFDNPKK